jgi:acetyl esterase
VEDIDVADLRESYELAASLARKPHPQGMTVSDYAFPVGARTVSVRVYRPASPSLLPGTLFLHGGGWVIGSIRSHDEIAAELAHRTASLVASVDYALAPEHPYPAAIEDVEAAAAWLVANASRLGLDPKRLGICGDSAGGHLASLYSVRSALAGRENPFCCQLLFYPVVDSRADTASYRDNADAPILSAALMRWFIERYCTEKDRDDPLAFPMRAPRLGHQPEAYIVTAGHDPLRDEALRYGQRLAEQGVCVTARHAADLVHGFLRLRHVSARAQVEFDSAANWLSQRLQTRPEGAL